MLTQLITHYYVWSQDHGSRVAVRAPAHFTVSYDVCVPVCCLLLHSDVGRLFLVLAPLPQPRPGGEPRTRYSLFMFVPETTAVNEDTRVYIYVRSLSRFSPPKGKLARTINTGMILLVVLLVALLRVSYDRCRYQV